MLPTPSARQPTSPMQVVAGLGCRSGCAMQELFDLLVDSLAQHELRLGNLAGLASSAHKRNEAGLQQLAEHLQLELHLFTAAELSPYQPPAPSNPRVQAATGAAAVAEPCALALARRMGKSTAHLLGKKRKTARATCALAAFTRESA